MLYHIKILLTIEESHLLTALLKITIKMGVPDFKETSNNFKEDFIFSLNKKPQHTKLMW